MAQQFGMTATAPYGRAADAFVILSMTVLSMALGAWFLFRMGLTLWWGMIGALAIYTVLLSMHMLVRRSMTAIPEEQEEEEADSAEASEENWLANMALASAQAPEMPENPPQLATTPAPPLNLNLPPQAPSAGPDLFAFRPTRPGSSALLNRAAVEPVLPVPTDAHPPPDARAEMSVEHIQDLIKKLADELNGPPTPPPPTRPEPANATEAMIGRSVAALEATARTMRADTEKPRSAPPASTGGTLNNAVPGWLPRREATAETRAALPPAVNPHLARIAEAVAAERMEVLLEPIHALAEGKPCHFEISVRLLTADGAVLEQRDFSRMAHGSGLMPRIDAVRMVRAARVARRLGERGRQGSVLASVMAESLTDDLFVGTAAQQPNIREGMRLVLSFAQSEVRTFTAGHLDALATMAAAGFDFALEEVTDLDMDFSGLKAIGFKFIELDAPVFLDGLPAAGGRIPASDICRHLANFGLTLIVGRIEDDWLLARVLGFGVLFGKGLLFGGPRLVKPEVVAGTAAAA